MILKHSRYSTNINVLPFLPIDSHKSLTWKWDLLAISALEFDDSDKYKHKYQQWRSLFQMCTEAGLFWTMTVTTISKQLTQNNLLVITYIYRYWTSSLWRVYILSQKFIFVVTDIIKQQIRTWHFQYEKLVVIIFFSVEEKFKPFLVRRELYGKGK